MDIVKYLDSTYLKTAQDLDCSEDEINQYVVEKIEEAIKYSFQCIMIRPKFISTAKEMIIKSKSSVNIGTVVDFPFGTANTQQKVSEANNAIKEGAFDIDVVCDYNAFKRGNLIKFDKDILEVSRVILNHKKIVKWIIETGALSIKEIKEITKRICCIIKDNFLNQQTNVFIKTSTGYYGGYGATIKDIKVIKSVAENLQIKASGGVSKLKDFSKMIESGATRVGTSKALLIYNEFKNTL